MCPDNPSKSCSIWNALTSSPLPVPTSTATSTPSGWPTRSAPEITIFPNPAALAARSFSSRVPASVFEFIAKRCSWSIGAQRSGERGYRAQLVRGHLPEPEEIEVERYLFEQHLRPDLRPAALLASRAQQGRPLLLHDHLADEGRRSQPLRVDRQGIAGIHAERRRVDDQIESCGIVGARRDLELRVVLPQPAGQSVRARSVAV